MDYRIVAILFDIDILKDRNESSNYAIAADRIVFRSVDPAKMPQVMLLSGDIDVPATLRPYSFCIAARDSSFFTGHEGTKHFVERLAECNEPGLFPKDRRFIELSYPHDLVPTARITLDGRLELYEYGVSCLQTATELGWRVLPDDGWLGRFAADYARAIQGQGVCSSSAVLELHHSEKWRALYLGALREAGCHRTIAAVGRMDELSDKEKIEISRVLTERIWPQEAEDERRRVRLDTTNEIARILDSLMASRTPSER